MNQLGFIFNSYPHSTSSGREGLDALLATSAYSDDIAVFFVGKGITQLRKHQQPELIKQRDYIATFKLLELYDIESIYVKASDLAAYSLTPDDLLIDVAVLSEADFNQQLQQCSKLLRF